MILKKLTGKKEEFVVIMISVGQKDIWIDVEIFSHLEKIHIYEAVILKENFHSSFTSYTHTQLVLGV